MIVSICIKQRFTLACRVPQRWSNISFVAGKCVYLVFAFALLPLSYVTVLKLRYLHVYCLFQISSFSILISQFHKFYKKGYQLFPCVICSYKKVKKKKGTFLYFFQLSGCCGIRTHNLYVKELQLALEKSYYTPELSRPINVKD